MMPAFLSWVMMGPGEVVRGHHGGQQGHVDGEGLLGEGAAAADLVAEGGGRGEDERGDDAETAGVGDGRGQVGGTNVHHAALDNGDWRRDRMLAWSARGTKGELRD
ncbi:hypothetical protein NLG97_g4784 [Lecanicillium saksenae]|uniref:Uncharacterized protein n=1 Tax=Lecanicillium saksenae TaxID=468837 RepID=A0ACC1QXH7_9HYPO|nr:hypothetical protein NLG97_g4784 [Lecanicillium saksenae]